MSGAGQLPAVLLALLVGALVDRWDWQQQLVVTQLLAMLQALGLGWYWPKSPRQRGGLE